MALEDLTGSNKYIANLVNTNPLAADDRREGDDHIRGIKNVLLNTFGPLSGPVDIGGYVQKAGDTMTGAISYPNGARIALHDANFPNIQFGPTAFGFVLNRTTYELIWQGTGGVSLLSIGNNGVTTARAGVTCGGDFKSTFVSGQYGGSFISYAYGDVNKAVSFSAQQSSSNVEALIAVNDNAIHKYFLFSSTGNATAPGNWVPGSDGRVKINRQKLDGAIEKIQRLTGYAYDRSDWAGPDGALQRDVGLIAQDVGAVLPEAVIKFAQGDYEDFHGLNYNAVTALLVNACKELAARVEALELLLAAGGDNAPL